MPPLRTQLASLTAAAPGAAPINLAATGWFNSVASYDEIEAAEREFAQKFHAALPEFFGLLGEPKWSLPKDRDWFDQWWAESLEGAAWDLGDRVLCLGVEHQDKETPIILSVRCLTKIELAELAA